MAQWAGIVGETSCLPELRTKSWESEKIKSANSQDKVQDAINRKLDVKDENNSKVKAISIETNLTHRKKVFSWTEH